MIILLIVLLYIYGFIIYEGMRIFIEKEKLKNEIY